MDDVDRLNELLFVLIVRLIDFGKISILDIETERGRERERERDLKINL